MKNIGTQEIITDRLILRKFTNDDANNMYKNWASDEEVTKYLRWKAHKNINITRNLLNLWVQEYKSDNNYQWAIELKEIGEVIGSISIVNLDEKQNNVEIGYCIGKTFWYNGYTAEALSTVIKFFFEEADVREVRAKHDTRNINSGKVMQKCGMTFIGTGKDTNNQGECETNIYSIINKKGEEYNDNNKR